MTVAPKVLIIAGGLTHERDVSLRSGRRVANVLSQQGFSVTVADTDPQLVPTISTYMPDVVWPLVHGSIGEDGSLQAILDSLGIPFVGTPAVQAMLASSKPTSKALLRAQGFDTPDWVTLPHSSFKQLGATHVLDALIRRFTYPVVVKPTDGGSALGLSTVNNDKQLRAAMVDAFAYGERIMIEQFISGSDIAVGILDLDSTLPLPAIEISTDDGRYNYEARYTTGGTSYFIPPRLSEKELSSVSSTAVAIHRALGLRHLSRQDFIVDSQGKVWFIDCNIMPGMTDTSLYPQEADAYSSFAEVCEQIVHYASTGDMQTNATDCSHLGEPSE